MRCTQRLLALALTVVSTQAFARRGGGGMWAIKGGANYSLPTAKDSDGAVFNGYKSGAGYLAGLSLNFGTGVVGFAFDILYANRLNWRSDATTDLKFTTTSLHLPAYLKLRLGALILEAGGYYAYGLDKIKLAGSSAPAASQTYKEFGMTLGDYGAMGGVGLMLGRLLIEGRYNYGLANRYTPVEAKEVLNTSSADLLVGFMF